MCSHRPNGRWARIWSRYLVTVLGSFLVLEGVGMATEGSAGTLSSYLQHLAGAKPRCQHVHLGRLTLIAFFSWAVAHLGWDILGFDTNFGRSE